MNPKVEQGQKQNTEGGTRGRILIDGQGKLCLALVEGLQLHLGRDRVCSRDAIPWLKRGDIVVMAMDGCRTPLLRHWEQVVRARQLILYPIHVMFAELVFGPVVGVRRSGCLECWRLRYFNNRKKWSRLAQALESANAAGHTDPYLTPLAILMAVEIACDKIAELLKNKPTSEWSAYYLDLINYTGEEHALLPHPLCPFCNGRVVDSPEAAVVRFATRPKPSPEADRLLELGSFESKIKRALVDGVTGVILPVAPSNSCDHVAVAVTGLNISQRVSPEVCSGMTNSYADSCTAALIEATERHAGFGPSRVKPSVWGSYSALKEIAIDPATLGLPSEEQYKLTKGILIPYSPNLQMHFIWSYSLMNQKPVLLPQQVAYYSFAQQTEPVFLVAGSRGCATGSCAQEAIYHAILEVVERDSFLITWHRREPPKRICISEVSDIEVKARFRYFESLGYEVLLFDITTEFEIPCVWLYVRNRDFCAPYSFSVSAAHPDPERAIRKAAREITAVFSYYMKTFNEPNTKQRAVELAQDPDSVREMRDHALLYCMPEVASHLKFLEQGVTQTELISLREKGASLLNSDMTADVVNLAKRFFEHGHDVIVVNQTTPEQEFVGLCTYKAVIPGTIPMAFGMQFRRLLGLSRLSKKYFLHYVASSADMLDQDINPLPHPFPS